MTSVHSEEVRWCISLHRYNNPISFPESGGFETTIPLPPGTMVPVMPITMSFKGDYVQVPKYGAWLIDSGACNHYTAMCHILSEFHHTPNITIQTGSGFVVGKGIGNVTIHSSLGI